MIFPSFFVSWKCTHAKKKKTHQRLSVLLSPLFSTFSSVSKFDFGVGREKFHYFVVPCFFFTWDWSQPALKSILTGSACFVSWKFLILLMQTEMLSSAVHHALGSRAWAGQLFLFFFFFEHISQILEKRPEKSIKSMNGFPSKTHAFKGETEGYRGWGRCWE